VLTEQVSDAHLAGLRRDGVSYIFASERELDLALALENLNRELGIERLLLEGGGKSNGSFLRAGLIDAMSPRHARLCRPRRLPHPARPREKPGFSTREGEIPRDTDSPLEGNGFELPVPLPIGNGFEALSEMGTPC
jgi:hypothetical protein